MQEAEISRQAVINDRQGEVINRLKESLISMEGKCKPEVLETGKNTLISNGIYKIWTVFHHPFFLR